MRTRDKIRKLRREMRTSALNFRRAVEREDVLTALFNLAHAMNVRDECQQYYPNWNVRPTYHKGRWS